jgi:hypothetical protein
MAIAAQSCEILTCQRNEVGKCELSARCDSEGNPAMEPDRCWHRRFVLAEQERKGGKA